MVSMDQVNASYGRKDRTNSVMTGLTNTLVEGRWIWGSQDEPIGRISPVEIRKTATPGF